MSVRREAFTSLSHNAPGPISTVTDQAKNIEMSLQIFLFSKIRFSAIPSSAPHFLTLLRVLNHFGHGSGQFRRCVRGYNETALSVWQHRGRAPGGRNPR